MAVARGGGGYQAATGRLPGGYQGPLSPNLDWDEFLARQAAAAVRARTARALQEQQQQEQQVDSRTGCFRCMKLVSNS